MGCMLCTVFLTFVCSSSAWGGCFFSLSSPALSTSTTISLTVPRGTTLQVALDKEVRVKRVGQPIRGRVVEPVYAFDQEVIPVGGEVLGRITKIERVSKKMRLLTALNLDFTPTRKIQVEFDEIILADGKRIPIKTVVTPGSGRAIRLVTTVDQGKGKTSIARQKMKEAIQQAKRRWQSAMKQVKAPGRMGRLARFAVAKLPVHPQYIDAGTVYFAELQEPLSFGSKPLPHQTLTSAETPLPPCNLLAHAQLVTPLSSAATPKDASVEAVLSQPLVSADQLIFPQGTLLKGSVVQAQPARRFGRNGKLRIVFNELVPPGGAEQKLTANLEGIQAGEEENVKLDSEGGTRATPSKKRYVPTGMAVALAVASYEDSDAEDGVTSSAGGSRQGAFGGAAGFKLVGILVGAFAHSRPLALGMGLYGVSRSAYANFLTRGREVVFPKGTAMEIEVWLTQNCNDSPVPDEGGKTND